MEYKGVYVVVQNDNDEKFVINYVEKGVKKKINGYSFDTYGSASKFIQNNKKELDECIAKMKADEQKIFEENERNKSRALAEERKQSEREKNKKMEDLKRYIASLLVASVTLTGGHFAAKGISATIAEKGKGGYSNSTTTEPTIDPTTTPTINVEDEILEIISQEDIYSTENLENLIAEFSKKYVDNNVSIDVEDLVKFVVITNIDRLVEENPEFARDLFSVQTAEEFLNDAAKNIGVTYMYNHTIWETEGKTDNFIWFSKAIPEEEPQREKMELLENYVERISFATKAGNADLVNSITEELIEELTSPTGRLNAMDDGVEFAAQVYFALINNSLGRNYLNQQNRDYFNTRASAEQNVSNIFAVYNRCTNDSKTRSLGK